MSQDSGHSSKDNEQDHGNSKKHLNGSDDEDANDMTSSITYSRKDGKFSINERSAIEDLYGDDAIPKDVSGIELDRNIHRLTQNKKSRKKSLSKEKLVSTQLSQWNYNNNRVALNRSILQVRDLLQQTSIENQRRPVNIDDVHDLYVLQVNFKLEGNYHGGKNNGNNIQLDKDVMAKLLTKQIQISLNHLSSLQKRVDDVSSKVFITGDLNTGKSSFCNSLLERHLLPEDQLPCTHVFCEILEARENDNIEEVHAILNTLAPTVKECSDCYNIRNHSTYETHTIDELDELVQRNDKYALLKIYIRDNKRVPEKSLLRNGTVDISLIDSPGLNMDSIQTSEVMARQEEIDLVIFVVNAENQLTLSAKEFIALASREKKLMFFVIKKFDKIRDKERCKKLISEQIKDLSPESYKRASEFVHFISEPNFPDDNGGNGSNPDSGSDSDNEFKADIDFENLENSLRNFVLKRRSQSKLLPAKTYLTKVLSDISIISEKNLAHFKDDESKINEELVSLRNETKKTKSHYDLFTSSIDKLAEGVVTETYDFTKTRILQCLDISRLDLPQYQGLSKIYDFIFLTEHYIKDQIKDSITSSEIYAKSMTQKTVETIYNKGKEELGDNFMSNRVFDSDLMFAKNLHQLSKKFSVPLALSDLYAPSWEGLFNYLSWAILNPMRIVWNVEPKEIKDKEANEKQAGSVLGLGDYPLMQYWKRPSLLFTSKLPALAIYSFGGSKIITTIVLNGLSSFSWKMLGQIGSSIIIAGSLLGVSYFIHDLPRALPHNLLIKYQKQLQKMDYIHTNAKRISNEVNAVFKTPTREIMKTCELLVDKQEENKRQLERQQDNNKISIKFFEQILQKSIAQKTVVDAINLDID